MTSTEILDNFEKSILQVEELLKDFPRDKEDFWKTAKRYEDHYHNLLTSNKIAAICWVDSYGDDTQTWDYDPIRSSLCNILDSVYGNVLEEIEDEFPVTDDDLDETPF